MEIEFINNHMIHVVISDQDLTERSLSLMELLGDHSEIESFFYGILDEIDTGDDFKNTDQVTFQVLPNRNGVELFISTAEDENNADEISGIFENVGNFQKREQVDNVIKNQLMETDKLDDNNRQTNLIKENKSWTIFKFERYDSMIYLSHRIDQKLVYSDFYSYKGEFYLIFRFTRKQLSDKDIENINSIAAEFSTQMTKETITPEKLDRQGKLLMEDNALEISKTYFKS